MTDKLKQYMLTLLLSLAALAVLLPVTMRLSGGVGSDRVSTGEHPLRISEYMSNNSAYPNGDGVICDWVEIENTSQRDFNVSGYRLSDDVTQARYAFPVGTVIPAGGRLVVWCSKEHTGAMYAPFSLKKQGGEAVLLMNSANTVLDQIETLHGRRNCSFIRLEDGSFTISTEPTPGYPNTPEGREAYLAEWKHADSPVRLSEVMAAASYYLAPDGQPRDWVEVENTASEAVDISGMHLSDKEGQARYTFPEGTVLPAGGFKVVWCSGDDTQGADYAAFKLSKQGGETVILSNAAGATVDRVTLPYLADDAAYARMSGGWTVTVQATPGWSNDEEGYARWLESVGMGDMNVIITEVVSKNESGLTDADGDHSDWIELYNAGTKTVSMAGWCLSDNPDKPNRWTIPNVSLAPGEYLVVFASGKDRQEGQLHTNFSLSAGETVLLMTPVGTSADAVELPKTAADHSWARADDGSWSERVIPTPGR